MEYDFSGKVIKDIAASALLSVRSLALGEASSCVLWRGSQGEELRPSTNSQHEGNVL